MSEKPKPANRLSVVIYDMSPMIHINEPCSHRIVVIELTPEQSEKLNVDKNEGFSTIILDRHDP